MKYIVVVFTSRTDTIHFYDLIKQTSTFCSTINTPRCLARSCGISVKIAGNGINLTKQIISSNKLTSFFGIYEINILNGKEIPTRIY